MSRRELPAAPSTPRVAWYFVVIGGENADGVIAGPYHDKPTRWERHYIQSESNAEVAAELLTLDEAREMAL